jgi:alpha-tubulin suppressor-like RCC1 family protein
MNIQIILNDLHKQIETTNKSIQLLMLSKALQRFNVGNVKTVSLFSNLPTASTNEGEIYLVESDERLYWSNGTTWKNFDAFTDSAWAWGVRVGDGTYCNRSSPVSVVGGFTDWCQVSAGNQHRLGVRTNGTLWAWGTGYSGKLGDGTLAERTSPVSVVGGFTDWCQVSACYNSIGVRRNGTAWAWGCNTCGLLGDGTTVNKSSPVSVVGGFTDWCQVDAGDKHNLGVRKNGTAWAWGSGAYGQLGDGTTVNKSSPVSVVGGFTDWCQLSAGGYHSVGLRTNATMWVWGSGALGRLGNGTTVNTSSPVSVVGGFTDWCQVSAGRNHTLAVRRNGTAWAWGQGGQGRLGDGTAGGKSSPVSVIGGFTDWCQVSAGRYHSLGVRQNGTVWAWGGQQYSSGILGNNNNLSVNSPVSVVGGFTDWSQVDAGNFTSVAIRKIQN